MHKKDYERAASIAQEAARDWYDVNDACANAVIEGFVRLFKADGNPRFDEARFRAACVPGANVKARPRKVAS
jgi:hypothetical protein